MPEQDVRVQSGVSDRFTRPGPPEDRRTGRADDVHVRDLPEPPRSLWRVVGPGIVGAGIGLASGEFIL